MNGRPSRIPLFLRSRSEPFFLGRQGHELDMVQLPEAALQPQVQGKPGQNLKPLYLHLHIQRFFIGSVCDWALKDRSTTARPMKSTVL